MQLDSVAQPIVLYQTIFKKVQKSHFGIQTDHQVLILTEIQPLQFIISRSLKNDGSNQSY